MSTMDTTTVRIVTPRTEREQALVALTTPEERLEAILAVGLEKAKQLADDKGERT